MEPSHKYLEDSLNEELVNKIFEFVKHIVFYSDKEDNNE